MRPLDATVTYFSGAAITVHDAKEERGGPGARLRRHPTDEENSQ